MHNTDPEWKESETKKEGGGEVGIPPNPSLI